MIVSALLVPNVSWATLVERAQRLEALGIERCWVDDHVMNPVDPQGAWFDCWTVLAGLAARTTTIRLGPLVANPVLRHPVVLARQALTVDHQSGGRLELGLGAGYASTDHRAIGQAPWSGRERQVRFAEAVSIVAALFRGADAPTGRYFSASGVALHPRAFQAPRPPLTVAAHTTPSLDVAARYGDSWVSYGGFALAPGELLARTRHRNTQLDQLCAVAGRSPHDVRRALLVGNPAVTKEPIWSSPAAFCDFAGRAAEAGVDELVAYYPPHAMYRPGKVADDAFERVVLDVLPAMRS